MNVLIFDTSTNAFTLALHTNEKTDSVFEMYDKGCSDVILVKIEELLKKNNLSLKDIDVIGVGVGPGSFTGIRVALSVAKGLSYGLDIPIVPISSLQIVANQHLSKNKNMSEFLVMQDARMNQVYWGICQNGIIQKEAVSKIEEVTEKETGVGTGFTIYENEVKATFPNMQFSTKIEDNYPQVEHSISYVIDKYIKKQYVDALSLEATYVRNKVVN